MRLHTKLFLREKFDSSSSETSNFHDFADLAQSITQIPRSVSAKMNGLPFLLVVDVRSRISSRSWPEIVATGLAILATFQFVVSLSSSNKTALSLSVTVSED